MVGMVSGHHNIMISTTLLANFDVCQKIFIRGTSCFGFEAEPHTPGYKGKQWKTVETFSKLVDFPIFGAQNRH